MLSTSPYEHSLIQGKVLQAMQNSRFVKTAFSLSHIFAALAVATAILVARLRAGPGSVVDLVLVNFGDFGHPFAFHDGPNLKVFRRTHEALMPVISKGACNSCLLYTSPSPRD